MNIGFESIEPTPIYASGLNATYFAGFHWKSQAAAVADFKISVKAQLRKAQKGRCCYCRRMLPAETMATDIEHFVEKAVHPNLMFEVINLALSCTTCNNRKNASYLRLSNYMSRKASAIAGAKIKVSCCPTVSASGPSLTNNSDYRWVHPHLDAFSLHISLRRSWVYKAQTVKGLRTIKGMQLNALVSLERRAAAERLASRKGTLAYAVGIIAELDKMTARTIGSIVAEELRKRLQRA